MFFKLFFDWSWHSVLCFIGFGCTAQWLNICINGPVFLPPTCSWSIEMQLACVLICYPVTLIHSLSVKWSPDLLIRCPGFRIHVREEHWSVTFPSIPYYMHFNPLIEIPFNQNTLLICDVNGKMSVSWRFFLSVLDSLECGHFTHVAETGSMPCHTFVPPHPPLAQLNNQSTVPRLIYSISLSLPLILEDSRTLCIKMH